jgi:hypothetical protein
MGSLQTRQNIQSIHQQIHNILYDKLTISKTSLITQDYSSRQAKAKLTLHQTKAKLELLCHIVATRSSDRVEEGVDEAISLSVSLL